MPTIPITVPVTTQDITWPDEDVQYRTGFTREIVSDVIRYLENGLSIGDCESALALPPKTVQRWYAQNFCNFRFAADRALTKNKAFHAQRFHRTGIDKTELSASQWWLERKHRDEFGKRVEYQVQHVVVDTVARTVVEVLHQKIKDPDQLRDIILAIRQELSGQKVQPEQIEHVG